MGQRSADVRPARGPPGLWVFTGWIWKTPAGDAVPDAVAKAFVPGHIADRDIGAEQPIASMEWLEARGYRLISMVVPEARGYRLLSVGGPRLSAHLHGRA